MAAKLAHPNAVDVNHTSWTAKVLHNPMCNCEVVLPLFDATRAAADTFCPGVFVLQAAVTLAIWNGIIAFQTTSRCIFVPNALEGLFSQGGMCASQEYAFVRASARLL